MSKCKNQNVWFVLDLTKINMFLSEYLVYQKTIMSWSIDDGILN
jgi:hypothetical protein